MRGSSCMSRYLPSLISAGEIVSSVTAVNGTRSAVTHVRGSELFIVHPRRPFPPRSAAATCIPLPRPKAERRFAAGRSALPNPQQDAWICLTGKLASFAIKMKSQKSCCRWQMMPQVDIRTLSTSRHSAAVRLTAGRSSLQWPPAASRALE